MLLLKRRPGDVLVVTHGNETLTIKLFECDRGKVVIGIEAPDTYRIARSEAKDGIGSRKKTRTSPALRR